MYCMHAQKGASEAPRTRFRACKTSKFSGGVPPDPPCTIYVWAPLFVSALGPSHSLGGPVNMLLVLCLHHLEVTFCV